MTALTESAILDLLEAGEITSREVADFFGADDRRTIEMLDGLVAGGWIEVTYRLRRRPAPPA